MHTTEEHPTVIGADCVVGHRAHLEGCVVEDGCLIGSGSLILNRARVARGAVVAAAALVLEDMTVPAGALAIGGPAAIREEAGLRQQTGSSTRCGPTSTWPNGTVAGCGGWTGRLRSRRARARPSKYGAGTGTTPPAHPATCAVHRVMRATIHHAPRWGGTS